MVEPDGISQILLIGCLERQGPLRDRSSFSIFGWTRTTTHTLLPSKVCPRVSVSSLWPDRSAQLNSNRRPTRAPGLGEPLVIGKVSKIPCRLRRATSLQQPLHS